MTDDGFVGKPAFNPSGIKSSKRIQNSFLLMTADTWIGSPAYHEEMSRPYGQRYPNLQEQTQRRGKATYE